MYKWHWSSYIRPIYSNHVNGTPTDWFEFIQKKKILIWVNNDQVLYRTNLNNNTYPNYQLFIKPFLAVN